VKWESLRVSICCNTRCTTTTGAKSVRLTWERDLVENRVPTQLSACGLAGRVKM
jgi:hypothetical protein